MQVLNNILTIALILSFIDIILPPVPVDHEDVPMWVRLIPGSEIMLWMLYINHNK
jgi:hypothetical protein